MKKDANPMAPYWNHGGWTLRAYKWKGDAYIALYRGRLRLGVLHGGEKLAHELAEKLGAQIIVLGEVRETPEIAVHEIKSYVPIKHTGNGWGSYDGPSTLAELQAADANDPGWEERDE